MLPPHSPWWKLGPVISLELAGDAGPAQWLSTTFSAVFGLATLFLLNKKNIADYTTLAYLTNIALVLQPNYDKSVSI